MIDEYLIEQMNILENEVPGQSELNRDELSEFFERYTSQKKQLNEVQNN
jgi:hypothetical protein